MISVVMPTRGFIFTEVEEALERNLAGYEYKVHRSFNLPIPVGHNNLTREALRDGFPFILFVEEDVVLPDGTLDKLLKTNGDIVCLDYSVAGWGCVTKDKKTDEILWCGLGATLVTSSVLKVMEDPYFRIDKALSVNAWPEEKWLDINSKNSYGGQDIYFCMKARKLGFKIHQIPGEAKHLEFIQMGISGMNNGCHVIREREPITKNQKI